MARLTFHHPDGHSDTIDVEAGTTVMRAALTAAIPGVIGECGGQAMCATCHVYIRDDHLSHLPEMTEDEDEMLDCTAAPRDQDRSRLGCQIVLGPEHDGLEVDLPGSQI